MLLSPRRLDVRAWLTLATAGPAAMLSLAAAASREEPAHAAGIGAALLLTPSLALAVKSLEPRDAEWNRPLELVAARGRERTLLKAFCLSTTSAAGVLIGVLAGAPLSPHAIAGALSVTAAPLVLAVGLYGLEAAGLGQAIAQPNARRRQRSVEGAEDEALEEMPRQGETRADVARRQARLRREEESRKGQQAVLVALAGYPADSPPRPWTDVDEFVDAAGGGAAAEVQAEAQLLQEARLEADEDGRPDVGIGEGGAQRLEGEEGPWVGLAFWQGAGGDAGGGGDTSEGQRVVEQGAWPLAHRLETGAAQLTFHPGAVADEAAGAGLQQGADAPGVPAGDVGGVLAVPGGEQLDDGPALAVGAGGEHEGVVLEFHGRKLGEPAAEIQPHLPPEYDAAVQALRDLLERYRAEVVESSGVADAFSISGAQSGSGESPNTEVSVEAIPAASNIVLLGRPDTGLTVNRLKRIA
jgi:hypothetical protein